MEKYDTWFNLFRQSVILLLLKNRRSVIVDRFFSTKCLILSNVNSTKGFSTKSRAPIQTIVQMTKLVHSMTMTMITKDQHIRTKELIA